MEAQISGRWRRAARWVVSAGTSRSGASHPVSPSRTTSGMSACHDPTTGMPVVGSWHTDIPEVVRDGETGWLAPERDVPALTTHLAALLQRPEIWASMGERGRDHVETEYNLRTQARRLDSIYDNVR